MSAENITMSIGKSGKHKVKHDQRTLNIANYMQMERLPEVPQHVDWTQKKTTPWGMMNNWTLEDCTCAAAGHMIECWTANAKSEHIIQDGVVMQAYIALTGYDPATGANDHGVSLLDALNYWRRAGIGNHRIRAYAKIHDHTGRDHVKAAIYFFGGVYVGLDLPRSIKGQEIWDVMPGGLEGANQPGSRGYHAVPVLAYDDEYLTCVSYGQVQKMTWKFWDTYCAESYAILTNDFLNQNETPLGLDMAALHADLAAITGGPVTTAASAAGASGTSASSAGTSAGSAGTKAGASGKSGS